MSIMDYIEASIKSGIGFYIGDPCHVLDNKEIYENWEKKYKYDVGKIESDCGTWFVYPTAYGSNGEYHDLNGTSYKVDSGTLSAIPLEVVFSHPSDKIMENGTVSTEKMKSFGNTVIRNGRELSCKIEVDECVFRIIVQMRNENGEWENTFDTEIDTVGNDD